MLWQWFLDLIRPLFFRLGPGLALHGPIQPTPLTEPEPESEFWEWTPTPKSTPALSVPVTPVLPAIPITPVLEETQRERLAEEVEAVMARYSSPKTRPDPDLSWLTAEIPGSDPFALRRSEEDEPTAKHETPALYRLRKMTRRLDKI